MADIPEITFDDETVIETVQHLASQHNIQPGVRRGETEHLYVLFDDIVKTDAERGGSVPAAGRHTVPLLPLLIPEWQWDLLRKGQQFQRLSAGRREVHPLRKEDNHRSEVQGFRVHKALLVRGLGLLLGVHQPRVRAQGWEEVQLLHQTGADRTARNNEERRLRSADHLNQGQAHHSGGNNKCSVEAAQHIDRRRGLDLEVVDHSEYMRVAEEGKNQATDSVKEQDAF